MIYKITYKVEKIEYNELVEAISLADAMQLVVNLYPTKNLQFLAMKPMNPKWSILE